MFDFEQAKKLVLAMNAANDQLPEEARQRCKEMLKESDQTEYDKARRLQLEQNRWTEKWYREHPDDTPETI